MTRSNPNERFEDPVQDGWSNQTKKIYIENKISEQSSSETMTGSTETAHFPVHVDTITMTTKSEQSGQSGKTLPKFETIDLSLLTETTRRSRSKDSRAKTEKLSNEGVNVDEKHTTVHLSVVRSLEKDAMGGTNVEETGHKIAVPSLNSSYLASASSLSRSQSVDETMQDDDPSDLEEDSTSKKRYNDNSHGNDNGSMNIKVAEEAHEAMEEARKLKNRMRRKERLLIKQAMDKKEKRKEDRAKRRLEQRRVRKQAENLYCFCQTPYDVKRFMIACDSCDEWFHSACINTTDKALRNVDAFYCPQCLVNNRYLFIRYRKKEEMSEDEGENENAVAEGAQQTDQKICTHHKCTRAAGPRTKYCSHQCALLTNTLRMRAMMRLAKATRHVDEERSSKEESLLPEHIRVMETLKDEESRLQKSIERNCNVGHILWKIVENEQVIRSNTDVNSSAYEPKHENITKNTNTRTLTYSSASACTAETPATDTDLETENHQAILMDNEEIKAVSFNTTELMPICVSAPSHKKTNTDTVIPARKETCTPKVVARVVNGDSDTHSSAQDSETGTTLVDRRVRNTHSDVSCYKSSIRGVGVVSHSAYDHDMCMLCGKLVTVNTMARHLFSCYAKNEALQVPQGVYNAFPYSLMTDRYCSYVGKSQPDVECRHLKNTCPLHSKFKWKAKQDKIELCSYPIAINVPKLSSKYDKHSPNQEDYRRCTERKFDCNNHANWEWIMFSDIERESFVLEAARLVNADEQRREKINHGFSRNIYSSLFHMAIPASEPMSNLPSTQSHTHVRTPM
eukprot:CFRG0050T1